MTREDCPINRLGRIRPDFVPRFEFFNLPPECRQCVTAIETEMLASGAFEFVEGDYELPEGLSLQQTMMFGRVAFMDETQRSIVVEHRYWPVGASESLPVGTTAFTGSCQRSGED